MLLKPPVTPHAGPCLQGTNEEQFCTHATRNDHAVPQSPKQAEEAPADSPLELRHNGLGLPMHDDRDDRDDPPSHLQRAASYVRIPIDIRTTALQNSSSLVQAKVDLLGRRLARPRLPFL